MVRVDVANGFYTAAEAASRYGVVLDGGRVDLEATRRQRSGRIAPTSEFSLGPEREDYERRLPPGVQDAVAAELQTYSGSYRNYLKEQVYDALTANGPVDLDPVALRERVRAILKSVRLGEAAAG
jgi:hypothetical protein